MYIIFNVRRLIAGCRRPVAGEKGERLIQVDNTLTFTYLTYLSFYVWGVTVSIAGSPKITEWRIFSSGFTTSLFYFFSITKKIPSMPSFLGATMLAVINHQ